jgi:hypothetical protein
MAMPASGCIGIITCPNGVACSSISQAVDGNVTPPKNLCALSVSAGKSAPHGMTEFYNYSSTKCVDICTTANNYNSYICWVSGCTCSTPAMTAGQCYCMCSFCICIGNGVGSTSVGVACVCFNCNGTPVYNCSYGTVGVWSCTGTFNVLVKCGDCLKWYAVACAVVASIARPYACLCFPSTAVCSCVGTFQRGTTYSVVACVIR